MKKQIKNNNLIDRITKTSFGFYETELECHRMAKKFNLTLYAIEVYSHTKNGKRISLGIDKYERLNSKLPNPKNLIN